MFKIFILLVPTSTSICTSSGCYLVLHKFQRVSSYLQNYIIHSLHNYRCFPVIVFGHIPLKNKILCKKSTISIKVEPLELPEVQWLCFLVPLHGLALYQERACSVSQTLSWIGYIYNICQQLWLLFECLMLQKLLFQPLWCHAIFSIFQIFLEDLLKFKN